MPNSQISETGPAGSVLTLVLLDGRRYRGTALEIVRAMLERAPFCEPQTVARYAAFVTENTRKFSQVQLRPVGADDASLAASLVAEMLRTGLAAQPN